MATYKKRGYKKPKEKVAEESTFNTETAEVEGYVEGEDTTEKIFENLDETAYSVEEWVSDKRKYIFGVVGAFIVVALFYLAYMKFVKQPNELEAGNAAYVAQDYFQKAVTSNGTERNDLFLKALEGADGKLGLVKITEEFDGTNAANLANYSAGMSYLNLGEYKKAASHLEKFSSTNENMTALAYGGLGDAFSQTNNLEDALNNYDKATNAVSNSLITPRYLYKAAITAIELKKFKKAKNYLENIKNTYPTSTEAVRVDALLAAYENGTEITFSEKAKSLESNENKEASISNVDALYNVSQDMIGKTVKGFDYLGVFIKKKLKDGTELTVMSKGFEAKLIDFIESDKVISKGPEAWFNLRRVLFATGSDKLDAKSNAQIDNVVKILKAYPNVSLKLGGYTDNTGNAATNKALSDRRAKSVMAAMVAKGIDAARLKAEGYGIEFPCATNDTKEGRSLNRRVAARVSKK